MTRSTSGAGVRALIVFAITAMTLPNFAAAQGSKQAPADISATPDTAPKTKDPKKGYDTANPGPPNCNMAPPCPGGCVLNRGGNACEAERTPIWRRLFPVRSS